MKNRIIPSARTTKRRAFLKGFLATIGLGTISAVSAIGNASLAQADPPHSHCVHTKDKHIRFWCNDNLFYDYQYIAYCTTCGDTCGNPWWEPTNVPCTK